MVVPFWTPITPLAGSFLHADPHRDGTFTEKGTLIFDALGHAKLVPQSELFVARPIVNGTSTEVFRRKFCRT